MTLMSWWMGGGGWNVNGFFVLFLCFIVVCEWV